MGTRQRTIKFPPKRGKLTIRQIERVVEKVIQKRRAQEGITSTSKEGRSGSLLKQKAAHP